MRVADWMACMSDLQRWPSMPCTRTTATTITTRIRPPALPPYHQVTSVVDPQAEAAMCEEPMMEIYYQGKSDQKSCGVNSRGLQVG